MDKAETYQKELKEVIEKQLELIKKGAPVDELAKNTMRFNNIADQIISDTNIYKPKRTVMLATISVYTNIFIDSLKRNKEEEKKIDALGERLIYSHINEEENVKKVKGVTSAYQNHFAIVAKKPENKESVVTYEDAKIDNIKKCARIIFDVMNNSLKKIPLKNYIILGIIVIVTFLLLN